MASEYWIVVDKDDDTCMAPVETEGEAIELADWADGNSPDYSPHRVVHLVAVDPVASEPQVSIPTGWQLLDGCEGQMAGLTMIRGGGESCGYNEHGTPWWNRNMTVDEAQRPLLWLAYEITRRQVHGK